MNRLQAVVAKSIQELTLVWMPERILPLYMQVNVVSVEQRGLLFTWLELKKDEGYSATQHNGLCRASQRDKSSDLALAASNHRRMRENKTVSQALFVGAIINRIIKRYCKLLPIAGVTFMSDARLENTSLFTSAGLTSVSYTGNQAISKGVSDNLHSNGVPLGLHYTPFKVMLFFLVSGHI